MTDLADRFFGVIALKNHVLTREQLVRALDVQQRRAAANQGADGGGGAGAGAGPTLGEVCRELGFLREDEVNAILWAQAKSEVLLEETLWGRIAVSNGLISDEQLRTALEEQKRRDYHVRLGEILVERGHIDRQQLQAVLKTQRRMQESARLPRPTIEPPATDAQPAAPAPAEDKRPSARKKRKSSRDG
jgi:hypothetical protein